MKTVHMLSVVWLGTTLVGSPALAATPGFVLNASSSAGIADSGAASQKGGQQTVPVDQLPAAVTAAVQKAYPKSTIVSAMKVSRAGQVRYELSVKATADAQPIAVLSSPEGVIRAGAKGAPTAATTPAARKAARQGGAAAAVETGETVAINQLPKVVSEAIKDAYPKDAILDATRIASGSQLLYRLTLSDVSHELPMLVFVSSDGKIQKR